MSTQLLLSFPEATETQPVTGRVELPRPGHAGHRRRPVASGRTEATGGRRGAGRPGTRDGAGRAGAGPGASAPAPRGDRRADVYRPLDEHTRRIGFQGIDEARRVLAAARAARAA